MPGRHDKMTEDIIISSGVVSSGGYVSATIHSGTIADGATVSDALLDVLGGGSANHTTVFSGGELRVSSSGVAVSPVICDGEDAFSERFLLNVAGQLSFYRIVIVVLL